MKLLIVGLFLMLRLITSFCGCELVPQLSGQSKPVVCEKPVIYLYPEEEITVQVRLDCDGELTRTYPSYDDGWSVVAAPDGTLTDVQGRSYPYLFWEGDLNLELDFSRGFCVAGTDTAAFLEKNLRDLGLTEREADEFIVYWLPRMQANPYNLIAFQQEGYTDHAALQVEPAPDTMLRVFMAYRPLVEAMEIEAQELELTERKGFTLVEWGGTEVEEWQ